RASRRAMMSLYCASVLHPSAPGSPLAPLAPGSPFAPLAPGSPLCPCLPATSLMSWMLLFLGMAHVTYSCFNSSFIAIFYLPILIDSPIAPAPIAGLLGSSFSAAVCNAIESKNNCRLVVKQTCILTDSYHQALPEVHIIRPTRLIL